ncbi:Fur family ferric uptake transcriptional regulator [Acinetobacter calcoaceticus]|nr:Fur family ferric uptake transcriptional regulator [Acinetobacter calcoaceticus]
MRLGDYKLEIEMLELQHKIKEAGLKVTHPRLAVLSLIQQQAEDLTVKQIYQKLYAQKQKLSLATVLSGSERLSGSGFNFKSSATTR